MADLILAYIRLLGPRLGRFLLEGELPDARETILHSSKATGEEADDEDSLMVTPPVPWRTRFHLRSQEEHLCFVTGHR